MLIYCSTRTVPSFPRALPWARIVSPLWGCRSVWDGCLGYMLYSRQPVLGRLRPGWTDVQCNGDRSKMRNIGVWMILVGLGIGFWQWQVNNIGSADAQDSAEQYARPGSPVTWSYSPVPAEDRYVSMAFAYLLCSVGGFAYAMSPKALELKRSGPGRVKAKSVKRQS